MNQEIKRFICIKVSNLPCLLLFFCINLLFLFIYFFLWQIKLLFFQKKLIFQRVKILYKLNKNIVFDSFKYID